LIIDSFGGRECYDEQAVRELSQGFVHGGYLQRGKDGRLTGEWVVFGNQDDVNSPTPRKKRPSGAGAMHVQVSFAASGSSKRIAANPPVL
jgi:hypothetical protein